MSGVHPAGEALPAKRGSEEDSRPENAPRSGFVRYFILIISICCLSCIMANIICFNFAVLCQPAHHKDDPAEGYDKQERTILFSAVAIGALLAIVPISVLIPLIGTKMIFLIAGLLSASSTALIPLASAHLYFFVAVRIVQGASFAACLPIVGSVTSSWATLAQNGLFMSVLTTFGQLSAVFSMPVSGELCESSLGWESIYYLHSGVCLLFFLAWAVLYYNTPEDHPCISRSEIALINDGKQTVTKDAEEIEKIPYLEILTTPTVWGVWIGALGDLISVQLVHTFSPLYIRQVLGYSVHRTGFAAAIPVLAQFIVKIVAGHSSDKIRCISETTKLRLYNTVALGASAIFMVALAFVKQGQGQLGVTLLTLTTAMFGFNGGGFNKCATLVSRQHSHFVLANIQFIWCLSMLLCPVLVALLLPTGDAAEWRAVFLIHAAILFLSNVVFCFLATAKPAPWTKVPSSKQLKRNTPMISRA